MHLVQNHADGSECRSGCIRNALQRTAVSEREAAQEHGRGCGWFVVRTEPTKPGSAAVIYRLPEDAVKGS